MKVLSFMNRSNLLVKYVLNRRFTSSGIVCNIDRSIDRWKVKKILESDDSIIGNEIIVKGWIRTIRNQKKISFIEINDGSSFTGIQVVVDEDIDSYSEISKLSTGSAIEINGKIVKSLGKNQKYEIQVKDIKLVGDCPVDNYPLQKKRHTQEFLRTIAHLRPRTNTIAAVARVRSALAYGTHKYFQKEGFLYIQTPLITSSDCEGAGEMFRVTTLPIDDLSQMPTVHNKIDNKIDNKLDYKIDYKSNKTDFSKDFFAKPTFLTVSGQLSAETYACALGDVYTFGPTFRAEKSQTTRHLAEFHMIEPELAFADLNDVMNNAEAYLKYVVKYTLAACSSDIDFFEKFLDKNVKIRLDKLINEPFIRISYSDVIRLLQIEIDKDRSKWQYPDVQFGTDLHTEHERWIAEVKFQSCVMVHNYPKAIKSFYMRDNIDDVTVDSFDMLVPGVGELIGGSQREERLDKLLSKMKGMNMNIEDYAWYTDLRKYGSIPHSGYGLGFERLVCYVTGIENIREAIAYPRYIGNAEF